jgi:hypothetical protein
LTLIEPLIETSFNHCFGANVVARKYQKYVKETGSTLGYQRAIPTKLLHISPTKLFTYPLGLPRTASDAEISVAWARADDSFALHIKTLQNSSSSAFTETEIDRLAEEFLRRRGLTRGQFADVVDPELRKIEDERQEDLQQTNSDYADYYVSEYDEVRQEIYRNGNRPPTVKEATVIRAYQAVQTRRRKVPSTLNTLCDEYLQFRGVEITTRDGAHIQGRWNNLMVVMRDVKISEHTPDHIGVGIDEFVEKELSRGQKPSSIDRNLREPIACFRWANCKHKLKWRPVEIPMLPKQKAKERKPLPNED